MLDCYITLGSKYMLGTNTLAYGAYWYITKKFQCCEFGLRTIKHYGFVSYVCLSQPVKVTDSKQKIIIAKMFLSLKYFQCFKNCHRAITDRNNFLKSAESSFDLKLVMKKMKDLSCSNDESGVESFSSNKNNSLLWICFFRKHTYLGVFINKTFVSAL